MTKKELMAYRRKRNKKIVRLYTQGLKLEEVGKEVGLTGTAVMFVLKDLGVPRRGCWDYVHDRVPSWKRAHEQIKKVANLYGVEKGYSAAKLSKRLGICPETVRAHLRDLGVKLRSGCWPQKLTEEQVRQIKIDLVREVLSFTDLAAKYRVSKGIISNIATGRKWKRVPWPNKTGYRRRGQGRRPLGISHGGTVLKRAPRKTPSDRK